MKGIDFKERFRSILSVVLSSMLVLSMCPTTGFAEQIEATPEDEPTNGEIALEAQGDDIPWTDWTSTDSLPTEQGYYRLTDNVWLDATWSVPAGTTNLHLNGKAIVTYNTKGNAPDSANNIELDDFCSGPGRTISVTDTLAEGASMGITCNENKPFTFTAGYTAAGNTEAPASYFSSDDDSCSVLWANDGKEGRLVAASTAHAITVDNKTSDLGTVAATLGGASTSQAAAGDTITVIATPTDSEQYTLDKLTVTKTSDPNTTVNINYDNTFTMPDYDVTVTASFRERHFHDGIEFEPWRSTADQPLPNNPGDYYLTDDVTLTNTWDAPCGGNYPIHLCLNGHSITLDQNGEDPRPVIRVKQGENGAPCKFVLFDNDKNEGTVTHANGKKGSGVWVESGGTFVMKGGTISNNDTNTYGGGVCVRNGGSVTMEGGSIAQNAAVYGGGGVAVEGGTFTLTDGTIQNNGGDRILYGGGVYVGNGGTFNLFGGTITNNQAARGGGIAGHASDGPTYQIHLSGNPKVKDNRAERENYSCYGDNLCLIWPNTGNVPITIDGPLEKDDKIGIAIIRDQSMGDHQGQSFEYTDGVFTTWYKASQSTDPWQYFTSENPGRQVLWTPDGTEAQLTVARHITVDPGITGGTVAPSRDFAAAGETIPIQAMPNEGWELVSVTAKDADGKDVAVTNNKELVVPASNVVVSATFKEKPAPATPPTPTPSSPSPEPTPPSPSPEPTPADIHVMYAAHVQNRGDLPAASDGEVVGTTGESLRLEAMSATVDAGGIEYRAHLQNKGWDSWVADGMQAGTTGESRRLEAIQMRLTGSAATDDHHVWYRVHSQDHGWLGWACDGAPAGTAGMSKRVEAYQVLVLLGDAKPSDYDASKPAYKTQASANAHLQGSGWTGTTGAGMVGTTGQSRRMEGIRLYAPNQPFAGGIAYQVHEQGNGWTAQKSDGALAGTTGESRRIEAVRIHLTSELADHLSVWYRVHSQTYGWSGWACDGAPAGTEGLSKRAEAVDIQMLSKDASAPGSTNNAFRTR